MPIVGNAVKIENYCLFKMFFGEADPCFKEMGMALDNPHLHAHIDLYDSGFAGNAQIMGVNGSNFRKFHAPQCSGALMCHMSHIELRLATLAVGG